MIVKREANPVKERPEESGFTLVEILIATLISAVVMSAVYTTYVSQQKSYVIQDQVAMMQQNLRNSIYSLEQEIRMAGYDPTGGANAGLVTKNSAEISFTMDLNGDRDTSDTNENITFTLASGVLRRKPSTAASAQAVAENIDALNFVYLDQDGAPTADASKVRAIQVMVLARTAKPDFGFTNNEEYVNQQPTSSSSFYKYTAPGDHYRRNALCVEIKCRNLGL
ncbi:MAG: prepilin-type N-terminal cleavage/methylation domain-containing protein [Desulfobacteraceae bacterium]|nr:MAG: prepilin-type N-terminal cleavage/methylation domain-containing protein [Desulfobacteraceae bacterium]